VREFLAVRRLRQGELEARLVAFEKGAESNEGLAEYVGEKGVLAALQAGGERMWPRMTKYDWAGRGADQLSPQTYPELGS